MKITTGQQFRKEIEKLVKETGAGYIDVITDYCAKHNLEVETAAKLVRDEMKTEIEQEARHLKMLKNETT